MGEEYCLKMKNLLCDTKLNNILYTNDFLNSDNLLSGLRQFRRFIITYRDDAIIEDFVNQIQFFLNSKNWTCLHNVLEKLFLEPINTYTMKILVCEINNKLTCEDILNCYYRNKSIKTILTG